MCKTIKSYIQQTVNKSAESFCKFIRAPPVSFGVHLKGLSSINSNSWIQELAQCQIKAVYHQDGAIGHYEDVWFGHKTQIECHYLPA